MDEHEKITKIVSYFPTPNGDIRINVPGKEPTPAEIANFQEYLEECAMAIPYEDSELGLAGMVMEDNEYKSINNNTSFVPPTQPGPKPQFRQRQPTATGPATRATATDPTTAQVLQHQQKVDDWKRDKATWSNYKAGQTALRHLILDNVDDEYVSELKHAKTKYKQVAPQKIMKHLKDYYGKVDDAAVAAMRLEVLNYAWSPATPITTMFKRFTEIERTSRLAQHGISESELVSNSMVIIRKTGLFNQECDEWEKKNNYKWDEFQTYFVKESLKVKKHTSAQLGYAEETAAAVVELSDELNAVKAILENERASERAAEQVNTLTAADIKDMICKEIAASGTSSSTTTSTKDTFKKVKRAEGYSSRGQPLWYCHTHGITDDPKHNSRGCKNKGENHDVRATLYNRRGGSEAVYWKS